MSQPRKNHLNTDVGQVKEDEHVALYKPIPESDAERLQSSMMSENAHEIEYIEANSEYIQLNQEDIEAEDNDEHWEHKSIKLMLNLYLQNIEKFRNPKVRKKNVWIDISNAVGRSPDSCDKKFRNLKQTYIRLLKKKNMYKSTTVKWPYFEIFEEIYSVNGEHHPDIQQKIQESSTESVAKALLSMNTSNFKPEENGESSNGQSEEVRKRQNRKRHAEFKKVAIEMRERQRSVEEKLDKLINIVEESNSIQKERNRLFQQFLDKLNQNP